MVILPVLDSGVEGMVSIASAKAAYVSMVDKIESRGNYRVIAHILMEYQEVSQLNRCS